MILAQLFCKTKDKKEKNKKDTELLFKSCIIKITNFPLISFCFKKRLQRILWILNIQDALIL